MSWSRGRGERGLLGRGVSVSACAYALSRSAYCLLPTAYCLLPTACAVLLSAMYVYVCVCAESIHVVKQFYLGPRCVCVCVCVCYYFPLQGGSPVPRGGQRCRTAARSTRPHALQAPSAAHHALPVSGQSSVVHVPLCRCVSCALCENLRAPN